MSTPGPSERIYNKRTSTCRFPIAFSGFSPPRLSTSPERQFVRPSGIQDDDGSEGGGRAERPYVGNWPCCRRRRFRTTNSIPEHRDKLFNSFIIIYFNIYNVYMI